MGAPLDHKVYGHVTKHEFYSIINRAKKENVFTNAEGRVDIGGVVAHLVLGFAKGEYKIIQPTDKIHSEQQAPIVPVSPEEIT